MKLESEPTPASGRVASLHLHPPTPGSPLLPTELISLVAGQGIAEDPRYFDRRSQTTGEPSRRQVSLIEREVLAEHAAALGLQKIAPGAVRANLETTGVNLQALVGHEVQIGEAVVLFYEARQGCAKMDAVAPGLREQVKNQRLGVLAEVVRSGKIRIGNTIRPHSGDAPAGPAVPGSSS